MLTTRRQDIELLGRCQKCADLPALVFWVRKRPDGIWEAALEKSTTAAFLAGNLVHRPGHCGGLITIVSSAITPIELVEG